MSAVKILFLKSFSIHLKLLNTLLSPPQPAWLRTCPAIGGAVFSPLKKILLRIFFNPNNSVGTGEKEAPYAGTGGN